MNARNYRKYMVLMLTAIALVLGNLTGIAAAQEDIVLRANVNHDVPMLNVRSGPGYEYPVLRQIPVSWQVGLIGRKADDSWYQIQSYDGTTVEWIHGTAADENRSVHRNVGGVILCMNILTIL